LIIRQKYLTLHFKVLFMKTEQDYIDDLSEIRSMMERSSRFLSLTGWSGIMAGLYALLGAYLGYRFFYLNTEISAYNTLDTQEVSGNLLRFIFLAVAGLLLALGTAIFLSWKKSQKNGERIWNAASRRLCVNLAIPLATGGIFILILLSKGMVGLIAPVCLLFYGLALVNASKFTFEEVKYFGIIEIVLGLVAANFIGYGLLFWAIGFGVLHILYGIYMQLKYGK
jgi:hypothetical protein